MSQNTGFQRPRQESRARPVRTRLQVERLEDRSLPSVNVLDDFAGLAFDPREDRRHRFADTHMAAGPNHLVEVTNRQVAFIQKDTGNIQFSESMLNFFAPVNPVAPFLFDPKVTYDELAGRFIVVDLNIGPIGNDVSYLLLAVSDDANPMGQWEMHRIDVEDPGQQEDFFADFPGLGWDADAIYVTMNMFGYETEAHDHLSIITIEKASVLDKDNSTITYFDADRPGPQHFTMQPAVMHGAGPGDPMYFVEGHGSEGPGREITVVRMTNKLSASPTFTDFRVQVPHYDEAPDATQPGGLDLVMHGTRLFNVAWRGNHLVTAHNTGTSGSDKVAHARWYEFDTSGPEPTLIQSGEIDPGPRIHTYLPSIEIAPNFDIGMTFMQSSATEFMSMYVTSRKAGDPLGTMQAPVRVKAGEATFRVLTDTGFDLGRVPGDYGGISIDPDDDTFWAAHEYATATHPPPQPGGFTANWGTWIANFSISPLGIALRAVSVGTSAAETEPLSEDRLNPLLLEAVARWTAAGFDTSALGNIPLQVTNLGGRTLGMTDGNTIWLDDNAAGWGWFADPTPGDDSEFMRPGNQGEQNRMDLLTVIAHELGHVLGFEHDDDGVMAETLAAGIRQMPGSDVLSVNQVFATSQNAWWADALTSDVLQVLLSTQPRRGKARA